MLINCSHCIDFTQCLPRFSNMAFLNILLVSLDGLIMMFSYLKIALNIVIIYLITFSL